MKMRLECLERRTIDLLNGESLVVKVFDDSYEENYVELQQGDNIIKVSFNGAYEYLLEMLNAMSLTYGRRVFRRLADLDTRSKKEFRENPPTHSPEPVQSPVNPPTPTPAEPTQPPRSQPPNYIATMEQSQAEEEPPNQMKSDNPESMPAISPSEAILLFKTKDAMAERRVRLKLNWVEMIELIAVIWGGRELYINGELKKFFEKNIIIEGKLFRAVVATLVEKKLLEERNKTSKRSGYDYKVYRVPRNLLELISGEEGQVSLPRTTATTEGEPGEEHDSGQVSISYQEAVEIFNSTTGGLDQPTKVRTSKSDMQELILRVYGGRELFVRGELELWDQKNLILNHRAFWKVVIELEKRKLIGVQHKISKNNHPYKVYVVPKSLGDPVPAVGEEKQESNTEETSSEQEPITKMDQAEPVLRRVLHGFRGREFTEEEFTEAGQRERVDVGLVSMFFEQLRLEGEVLLVNGNRYRAI